MVDLLKVTTNKKNILNTVVALAYYKICSQILSKV